MYEAIIFDKVWLVIPVWIVVYALDYYLTILGAKYYRDGGMEHFATTGSYELTPEFQKDIDEERLVSVKFLKALIVSSASFAVLWYFSKADRLFEIYYIILVGGMILRELAVLFRHAGNLYKFKYAKDHTGVSGKVVFERWLTYRLSGLDLISFGVMFLIIYLLTGSIMFLGGAIIMVITAFNHFRLSKALETKSEPVAGGDATRWRE